MPSQNVLSIAQLSPSDLVFLSPDNDLVTDSFLIAKYFSKRHDNVIQKIKALECSSEFTNLNFQVCHKNNNLQNNKLQPFYQITKNGFMFLVMGFTGKRASLIKEAYINAFDLMAEQLKKQSPFPPCHRTLTLFENGQPIESKLVPNDAFIISKSKLPSLLQEGNVFTVDELLDIANSANRKIAELAKIHGKQLVQK
ncbi:Rha family transcriptional regulator [Photobacterium damselae subsp. damselae]|uniref:Rha family transcriptional regulator n=1 Tax=Photobacterium damselae TaxID=38293 RepID=UPI001F18E3EF|nr:Rha family transcriptional regulator [Photobacterium damselae]UKA08722.1 Rha family transcriptional regulator [Photobacterium damselae subsp. damselae]UKA22881.1 Rha family transcriptional regulator [Photobacterium damselae subsp. damselae]